MRIDRLLTRSRTENGSAAVESTFAIIFILLLVLGAIEVAFALYGRNVVLSAAHEGARTAVELGRDRADTEAVARAAVMKSAGGIVDQLDVAVEVFEGDLLEVAVRVDAIVDAWGPIPFPFPVESVARARAEAPLP